MPFSVQNFGAIVWLSSTLRKHKMSRELSLKMSVGWISYIISMPYRCMYNVCLKWTWVIIGSGNGMVPVWQQAMNRTNGGLLTLRMWQVQWKFYRNAKQIFWNIAHFKMKAMLSSQWFTLVFRHLNSPTTLLCSIASSGQQQKISRNCIIGTLSS